MPRPLPLELTVEVETADGARFRWAPNSRLPGDRPRGLTFSTKLDSGFDRGGVTLSRRGDLDYPDLALVNSVTFIGADGSTAYEGRIADLPREIGDTHSVSVGLAGWMAHATDRKFREIFVDRDLNAWGTPPLSRRTLLLSVAFQPHDASIRHDASLEGSVSTQWTGAWASGFKPVSEAWYDAGPSLKVAKVAYAFTRGANVTNTTPFILQVGSTDVADASTVATTGNLIGGTGALAEYNPTPRRYAYLQLYYDSSPAGGDGVVFNVEWTRVAAYGNHGLTPVPGASGQPGGMLASEVMKNIAERFCPMLRTDGVQNTSYVIQHLTFKDLTTPYDAFLQLNKFHLWQLGVWENRTLHFAPIVLQDHDWEVELADPGVRFTAQGASTENLYNGVVVSYQDVNTGARAIITPDDEDALRDPDETNPWNRWGIDRWDYLDLSYPATRADAISAGVARLGWASRSKAPGTLTVHGYLRDRNGVLQPAWKVRAGDTIAIIDHPNDAPRLIHETTWDADARTLTVAVDAPASQLDAYVERVTNALQARGLT